MTVKNIISTLFLLVVGIAFSQETKVKNFAESKGRGALVYQDFCMQCHLPTGAGVSGVYPPLAKADFLKKFPKKSMMAVKFGMKGEITVNGEVYNSIMPNPGLLDEEVADVMNYINSNWGNDNKMVTEAEVVALEKE